MSIGGTWQGEYRFEEGACDKEGEGLVGKVVAFTMELQPGWLGSVGGTMKDDERTGFAEAGKIKGKLKGKVVEFRRVNPVLRLIHEPGRITLEQWAERRNVVMNTEVAGPAMLFEGELTEEGLTGTWRMGGETIEVPGSYQRIVMPGVGGGWRAKRAGGS